MKSHYIRSSRRGTSHWARVEGASFLSALASSAERRGGQFLVLCPDDVGTPGAFDRCRLPSRPILAPCTRGQRSFQTIPIASFARGGHRIHQMSGSALLIALLPQELGVFSSAVLIVPYPEQYPTCETKHTGPAQCVAQGVTLRRSSFLDSHHRPRMAPILQGQCDGISVGQHPGDDQISGVNVLLRVVDGLSFDPAEEHGRIL